jgi:hypothetical protein
MEVLPLHVQGTRASYFGRQPFPFHWLAADDFGRMVATSYLSDGARDKKLFVHGPEALTMQDTLRRYCAVLHPDITKISSMPFWLARLLAGVLRNQGMKIAVDVYAMYEQVGGDGGDPAEANDLLGAPSTTLDDWLRREHARRVGGHPR